MERFSRPSQKNFRRTMATLGAGLALGTLSSDAINTPPSYHAVEAHISKHAHELPPLPEFAAPAGQHVLAVLLKQPGDKEPYSHEEMNETLQEVHDFYKKISYGQINYTFTVTPWINTDLPANMNDITVIKEHGDKEVRKRQGLDALTFGTRLYFPYTATGTSAAGQTVNKDSWVYVKEKKQIKRAAIVEKTKHELLHTLGANHQSILNPTDPSDFTHGIATIDSKDVSYDVTERVALGWIKRPRITDVSASGNYTLSEINSPDPSSTVALRIQKADTNQRYYLQYVQFPNGGNALGLSLWDETKKTPASLLPISDPTQPTDFTDKINGIRITKQKSKDNKVSVQVTFTT